jgi:glucose-1-phosphate thymidylyltransferase
MRGVILAGGEGTRLQGLTNGHNKHSYEVSGKPMILYPLDNLKAMGCDSAVIVTNEKGMEDLPPIVANHDLEVSFRVQKVAAGAADALSHAEDLVSGVFPVLCGDVYFDPKLPKSEVPTLFWCDYAFGHLHSVWNPETGEIIEKPLKDIGKKAIVGYYYDERVFEVIQNLEPSERGELELVDLHRFYLENDADMVEHKGFFGDMGTPGGLERVEYHIQRFRGITT